MFQQGACHSEFEWLLQKKRYKSVSGISFDIKPDIKDATKIFAAPVDSIHKFIELFY